MQFRRNKLLLIVGGVVLAVLVWTALCVPVIVNIGSDPMSHEPRLTVWNPVRNRAPERAADVYLGAIHSAGCREYLSRLRLPGPQAISACEKQERNPVSGHCILHDRSDGWSGVWLFFECPYTIGEGEAWVELTLRHENGKWVLESYQRAY